MLSVHDDLIRAIKFIPAELRQKHEEVEKLVEGIEMTAGNLEKVSVILFFFLFFALPFRVPGAAEPTQHKSTQAFSERYTQPNALPLHVGAD